jgi:hypothetical protein
MAHQNPKSLYKNQFSVKAKKVIETHTPDNKKGTIKMVIIDTINRIYIS